MGLVVEERIGEAALQILAGEPPGERLAKCRERLPKAVMRSASSSRLVQSLGVSTLRWSIEKQNLNLIELARMHRRMDDDGAGVSGSQFFSRGLTAMG